MAPGWLKNELRAYRNQGLQKNGYTGFRFYSGLNFVEICCSINNIYRQCILLPRLEGIPAFKVIIEHRMNGFGWIFE